MGGPGYSITAETLMQTQEQTAVSTVLHPARVWERFADGVFSILKRYALGKRFPSHQNLHQDITFTMEEESNGELAFLHTLLKGNN